MPGVEACGCLYIFVCRPTSAGALHACCVLVSTVSADQCCSAKRAMVSSFAAVRTDALIRYRPTVGSVMMINVAQAKEPWFHPLGPVHMWCMSPQVWQLRMQSLLL
jgi:hypothetical protein